MHLTWWITYAEESDPYPAFQSIAEAYTERTGVVVDLVSVPWDDIVPRGSADPRLSPVIEAGDGPVLWGPVPHTWLAPYVARGQALALDPKQIQSRIPADSLAWNASRLNGQQYALPILMDSVALIYNRDLVPEPPRTFEELVQIAREQRDPGSDHWGLALPLLSPTHLYPFIDGYGGYILRCQVAADDAGDAGQADGASPADGEAPSACPASPASSAATWQRKM